MMAMRSGEFSLTPVENKLFTLLEDGQPHSIAECLLAATGKRFASPSLVPTHIGRLRPSIARGGYRIVMATGGYQMIKDEV
jgi:hypothetical protein